MASSLPERAELVQHMNVLPLIDVLLVLIVAFFLLNQGFTFMPAQIPAEADGAPQSPSRDIVLELRADGTVAINNQVVPNSRLEAELRAVYDGRPRKVLHIKAADSRSYQEVIAAMDLARGIGVTVVAWKPRPEERRR